MSRIIFCATPEGMRRQVRGLCATGEGEPHLLRNNKDVLDALLALETGRDVVADARSALTGWHLPEGVEIRFDEDMDGEENARLRDQCAARGGSLSPAPGLRRVTPDEDNRVLSFRWVPVRDPFGPHEQDLETHGQALETPEAA
jgi:hypothetical protein